MLCSLSICSTYSLQGRSWPLIGRAGPYKPKHNKRQKPIQPLIPLLKFVMKTIIDTISIKESEVKTKKNDIPGKVFFHIYVRGYLSLSLLNDGSN